MKGVSFLEDSAEAPRISAGKLVSAILDEVEFEDFVRAALFEVSGSHVQEHQKRAASRLTGVHGETVARWISGVTTPKARDFWPVAMTALLSRFDAETQEAIAAEILSMCGVRK